MNPPSNEQKQNNRRIIQQCDLDLDLNRGSIHVDAFDQTPTPFLSVEDRSLHLLQMSPSLRRSSLTAPFQFVLIRPHLVLSCSL